MAGWETVWVKRVPGWEVFVPTSGRASEKQHFRVIGRANRSQLAELLNMVYHMDKSREKPWILVGMNSMRMSSRRGITKTRYGLVLSAYIELLPGDEFEIQGLAGVDLKLITRENLSWNDARLIRDIRIRGEKSYVLRELEDGLMIRGIMRRVKAAAPVPPSNEIKEYKHVLSVAGLYGKATYNSVADIQMLRGHEAFMNYGLNKRIFFMAGDEKRVRQVQRIVGAKQTGRYGLQTYRKVKERQKWLNEMREKFGLKFKVLQEDGLWGAKTEAANQKWMERVEDVPTVYMEELERIILDIEKDAENLSRSMNLLGDAMQRMAWGCPTEDTAILIRKHAPEIATLRDKISRIADPMSLTMTGSSLIAQAGSAGRTAEVMLTLRFGSRVELFKILPPLSTSPYAIFRAKIMRLQRGLNAANRILGVASIVLDATSLVAAENNEDRLAAGLALVGDGLIVAISFGAIEAGAWAIPGLGAAVLVGSVGRYGIDKWLEMRLAEEEKFAMNMDCVGGKALFMQRLPIVQKHVSDFELDIGRLQELMGASSESPAVSEDAE